LSNEAKNIFISHIHEDDTVLRDLKDLVRRNGYDIRDGSIDSSKPNEASSPDYIKSEILAPRIRWASTLVVLISRETHDSEWVRWEIEYGHQQGKRIVGVWAQGSQDADVPEALELYADAVVGWQADLVMDAINGKINNWFTTTGEERAARKIPKYNCETDRVVS
jgi:antiphage defense system Thoeris ThsB-like protein